MELSGHRIVDAPREEVWAALLNPDVLKDCVPGCQEMTGTPEDGFTATVVQKVGPVKATFKGVVTLEDMNEPESLTLNGEGKGGAVTGGDAVDLHPVEIPAGGTFDGGAAVGALVALEVVPGDDSVALHAVEVAGGSALLDAWGVVPPPVVLEGLRVHGVPGPGPVVLGHVAVALGRGSLLVCHGGRPEDSSGAPDHSPRGDPARRRRSQA